ncbi:PREDICTED: zinc-finger homeodomain protein 5-like [Prunus mume]|uniref:Zinc-finger homeodomain protein 5-like n=1 Tax=Prunus mume TaxID=102107 RepID=A0ABM0PMW4_PRUMU|nr:PREDICTED: zinc-finger homeodomain protein 5-like [Prunus mume]
MEVRGQDKVIGMPTTLGYNPPNRDSSSSKLSSSPALPSTANNTIFINPLQTLDPHPPPHHHQPHQLNLSPHKSSRRDSEQNPDPISSPIVVTPSATSIPGGSNFKAPPVQPPPAPQKVRYRECLKNHAASSGGHVLDGCGEFMPSGEEDIPEALKCAACECHRNFHRKEIEGDHLPNNYYVVNHQKHTISRRDSETRVLQLPPPPPPQKEKMMEVAEKLGWKIQRHDEQEVQKLCSEVGIKRQVFKVWMHNNKQAMKKKQM